MEYESRLAKMRQQDESDLELFFIFVELMAMRINFPIKADWLGERVMLTAVNQTFSSHSHGLKFVAANHKEPLSRGELTFHDLDPTSAEWLGFYDYFQEVT